MQRSKAKLIKQIAEAHAKPMNAALLKSFLADIRKLLETTGTTKTHATLKFHCDWVLHTRMDKTFAKTLLKRFDDAWDNWITRKIPFPRDFSEQMPYLIGFFGFTKELREVLGTIGLSAPAETDIAAWQPFERLYCSIVEDTDLHYPDKKHPLRHINGARVAIFKLSESRYPETKAEYEQTPKEFLPFGIEWTFMLDGLDVFAIPLTFPSPALVERDRNSRSAIYVQPPPHSAPQTQSPRRVNRI